MELCYCSPGKLVVVRGGLQFLNFSSVGLGSCTMNRAGDIRLFLEEVYGIILIDEGIKDSVLPPLRLHGAY